MLPKAGDLPGDEAFEMLLSATYQMCILVLRRHETMFLLRP